MTTMRFFEPNDHVAVVRRHLPHWAQAGTVCFITWRTHDSIPKAVLAEWLEVRDLWLLQHEIAPTAVDWKEQLARRDPALLAEFHTTFTAQWQDSLDACHGECMLRRPDVAEIISKSLLRFDGERYEILDFVVMPNHVHLLATFPDEAAMLVQCESWKHFTAAQINRLAGRTGQFWQPDSFDHRVRHEAQFCQLRHYIAENPGKAHVKDGEFVLYTSRYSPRDEELKGASRGAR